VLWLSWQFCISLCLYKASGMHCFLMACFGKQYCQEPVHPRCLLSCNKHCFLTQLVPIDLQFIAARLAPCD
jgi:hypothetical protein